MQMREQGEIQKMLPAGGREGGTDQRVQQVCGDSGPAGQPGEAVHDNRPADHGDIRDTEQAHGLRGHSGLPEGERVVLQGAAAHREDSVARLPVQAVRGDRPERVHGDIHRVDTRGGEGGDGRDHSSGREGSPERKGQDQRG